jgi:ankyrin repeat protein
MTSGEPGLSDAVAIHEAYRRGDLEALKAAIGNPPDFPNCRGPVSVGEVVLEYAIYWSPIGFVRALLELGANPNYGDDAGFPALLAALSTERSEMRELIQLLLSYGADIERRGLDDWTALHFAIAGAT